MLALLTSLSVNFATPGATPSAGYAGGTWQTVTGVAGQAYTLVTDDGKHITLTQSPTTTLLQTTDPSVSGDDAVLLDHGLVTTGAETCLMFSGFPAGKYEVLIYAWLPDMPTVKSRTRQDEAPSTIDVGGAWTGMHVEGVTYARYVVDVGADGNLPAHSGLAPGAPAAALNAVQIRPYGTGGGSDAGTTGGGPDAGGAADNGDAGTTTPEMHHGGCAAGGGANPFVLLIGAGVARRIRRRVR